MTTTVHARAATGLAVLFLLSTIGCAHAERDIVHETFPADQAAVRARLGEIWEAAARKDLDQLASYHLYGPKFTEFKDGAPRGDAASGEAGERGFFTAASDAKVDMKDLAVNVWGDVAVATFNGAYSAVMEGHPVSVELQTTMVFVRDGGSWKIVHEHMSPLGPSPAP